MYFLENDTVGLRMLSTDDLDIEGGYGDWFNDQEVCKYNSHHRFPKPISNLKSFIEECSNDRSCLVMAVEIKKSKKHIGNISLQQIDLINRQAEIAFLFGNKDEWGKGYACCAAELLIKHGFEELGLNRIYFGTSEENVGMQRLGEKLRFSRVGTRRKALYKRGAFHDIYDYDLLYDEWK